MPAVFLSAEWRSLVMLNYAVTPEVLAPHLPRGVELDLWQGEAVMSMVGFVFLRCRVFGVALPGLGDFEEVNLRFYVRRRVGGDWRRGVVFVREIVPSRLVAFGARAFYNEPYTAMRMRREVKPGSLAFEWRRAGTWERLFATTRGAARPMEEGSEAEFIFEHYWGYTRQRDGGTVEYQVEHPRWAVQEVETCGLECDAAALYGAEFSPALAGRPRSAFVAEGSAVQVRRGVRCA